MSGEACQLCEEPELSGSSYCADHQCQCRKEKCRRLACKGECGCSRCQAEYADFLSSYGE